MENWDIPYFTGMQSVKMPVLTTTGKNFYAYGDLTINNPLTDRWYYTNGKTSSFGSSCKRTDGGNWFYLEKGVYSYKSINENTLTNIVLVGEGETIYPSGKEVPSGWYVFRFKTKPESVDYAKISQIQLEKGPNITTYEPYKTNILSTSEDVALRGIDDVKDTLDGNTGELTQRIGEDIFDGSEDWIKLDLDSHPNGYYLKQHNSKEKGKVLTDKIKTVYSFNKDTTEAIYKGISMAIFPPADINELTLFKQWLSQNPITVQYELAAPTIKTVDLMPSGTHPSTTPYCWKNGHIQLSSSGLLPNLEYSVVTSRAGQINQNATMIVKNDKRIFDLEILLAGGLVNTTYQALTLQNQVETGLSKVSLNSETEPDYLLYHMIMKLIEEKAYKLDDLTEKVSVFYLYEKLSDEQFETIYSALYPFAEDEIIEEPVVEELPEVVEDEVIM